MSPQVVAPQKPAEPYLDAPAPLEGYWWETDYVCVPWVVSNGHPREFLRWLHELESKGKPVMFPTVISERLAMLLRLRGYVDAMFWAGEPFNEYGDALVLFPAAEPGRSDA